MRLGLAVGQRAARATFTVLEDGVESAAALAAPLAYRLGVLEGVFLDPDGYVRSTLGSTRGALNILRTLDEADACGALDKVLAAA
ncbi:hypothetical protein ABTN13_20125, partial [Acinetobacter baumannii]